MRKPPENLRELVRVGEALMVAMSFAQLQREKVDAIVRAILAEREYLVAEEYRDRYAGKPTERVLEPSRTYLIARGVLEREVYPEITRRQEAAGLFPEKPGCCPALEAEGLQLAAERVFIEHIGEAMGKGKDTFRDAYGETRKQVLKLGLGLVAPFVGTSEEVLGRFGVHPPQAA